MYTENDKVNNQIANWLFFMFLLISIMIVVGGLTRFTDSGLSITQWELFSGFFLHSNNLIGLYILIYTKKFLSLNCKITI